jgi:hypothetical protein
MPNSVREKVLSILANKIPFILDGRDDLRHTLTQEILLAISDEVGKMKEEENIVIRLPNGKKIKGKNKIAQNKNLIISDIQDKLKE